MNITEKQIMPLWGLSALSWLVSFYFFLGFVSNVGFPPNRNLLVGDALYVFLWLLFLFLPFFTKIKIGNFIELEREIEKSKEELREFKADVRNNLSVLSTNVNTIGGMTNQVTVNIPGLAELRDARQAVDEQSPVGSTQEAKRIEESLLLQSEDSTLALARTRIEIERLLRAILGKIPSGIPMNDTIKFMGTRQLFELFVKQHHDFAYLGQSFKYVTQICNAAIHAQQVSPEQADEALALGAQLIAVLNDIAENWGPTTQSR